MAEKKLSQLLSETLDDSASKTDVAALFKKLTDFVKQAKTNLESLFSKHKEEIAAALAEIGAKIDETRTTLSSRQDADKNTFYSESRTLMRLLQQEIARLEALIPQIPDLAPYDARFADIEGRIPTLPEELTPEGIRNKLEALQDEERLYGDKLTLIDQLLDDVTKLKTARTYTTPPDFRAHFKDIDLSPQLDGATKTFNIPATYNILSVHLSSFPHALRKNIDFTSTTTSITFTDQIDAATSLAEGQTCVLTTITG